MTRSSGGGESSIRRCCQTTNAKRVVSTGCSTTQSSAAIVGTNVVTTCCVTGGDFCTTSLQQGSWDTEGGAPSERLCAGGLALLSTEQAVLAQQLAPWCPPQPRPVPAVSQSVQRPGMQKGLIRPSAQRHAKWGTVRRTAFKPMTNQAPNSRASRDTKSLRRVSFFWPITQTPIEKCVDNEVYSSN